MAMGGDGTVHEVAAACVGRDLALGVLPVGSGNDYVKALGIGTDLGRALEVLAAGKVQVVDAGQVAGSSSTTRSASASTRVAAGVARAPAYLGGRAGTCGPWGGCSGASGACEATLRLDGGEVVEAETILVAVALGTTSGARFRLAPEARLDDGLFDVVWSEEVSRAEVLRLIPAALGGTLLRHPKVHLARAREVEVELAKEVPAHVDGEILAPTRGFQGTGVCPERCVSWLHRLQKLTKRRESVVKRLFSSVLATRGGLERIGRV